MAKAGKCLTGDWLTLTEAITLAVGGERLTDGELHARQALFDSDCQHEWGEYTGAGWLLLPLELILQRNKRPWRERKTNFLSAYDDVNEAARTLRRARTWLRKSRRSAPEAYRAAKEWVEKCTARSEDIERLYATMFKAAARGEIIFQGKEIPYGKENSVGRHAPIPPEFFLNPAIIHWRGNGGDLVPAARRDLKKRLREIDRRASYRDPLIKGSDVEMLLSQMDKKQIMLMEDGAAEHRRRGRPRSKREAVMNVLPDILKHAPHDIGPKPLTNEVNKKLEKGKDVSVDTVMRAKADLSSAKIAE